MEKSTGEKIRDGTQVGKEGEGACRSSRSRMGAEGERLLKSLLGLVEKHGSDPQRKAVEHFAQQARGRISQSNKAIEERTRKVVQRLKVPARRLRKNIDEGVKNGLNRFHFATHREMEEMAGAVGSLRKEVEALSKRTTTGKKAAAPKSA